MIRIEIQGAAANCLQPKRLTAGMVGAQAAFTFDAAWDGLTKWAVFTDGTETRDVLMKEDVCTVPHEVLTTAGRELRVGVYGTNAAGDVVLPTVYAACGVVHEGAEPSGDESYPATPDAAAQLAEKCEKRDVEDAREAALCDAL